MHIKQIIIQGFKSYKDQVVIDPFSPKCNLVVGRNGAGKSNFFSAIRFVLHDAYIKMTNEERRSLIHEGSNTNNLNMTTYVEIIFDNSDHRFPTGKDIVTLRRAIGMKKDEYYLDGKPIPKQDVMNLLQSAGFSKSNPYYIVPQGRIAAITNSKDEDRLSLLKEVAGTRVYEEHREESLKIIQSTNQKKLKIKELLESIEEKIANLDHEKADLAIYSELEKQKRSCEYHLFQRDLIDVQDNLDQLEETYKGDVIQMNQSRKHNLEQENTLTLLESEISTITHTLDDVQQELDLLTSNILQDETQQAKISASLSTNLLSPRLKQDLLTLTREQHSIQEQITSKQSFLTHLKHIKQPSIQEEESKLLSNLLQKKTQRDILIQKRGRSHHFSTPSERDTWLRTEIQNLTQSLSFERQRQEDLQLELASLQSEHDLSKQQLSFLSIDIANTETQISTIQSDLTLLFHERDNLTEKRKLLWREESKLDHKQPLLHEQLLKLERQMYSTCDRETSSGLESVRHICQTFPDFAPYVYGPVYELFTIIDPIYTTAIDIISGKSLFHIVVENDQIATQIVQIMTKEKSGRVTFLPLNRIQSKPLPSYQNITIEQGIPMIQLVKYDDSKLEPIFNQIFSKAILVPDLEQGCKLAKEFQFQTITLDGDRVDKKGSLTGGYIDTKRTRLIIAKELRKIQDEYSILENQLSNVKNQVLSIGQQLDIIYGKIQYNEHQLIKYRDRLNEFILKKQELERESDSISIITREKLLTQVEYHIKELSLSIQSMNEEIGTKLTAKLTKDETRLLENLEKEINEMEHSCSTLTIEKTSIIKDILSYEHELQDNLMKRNEQLLKNIKNVQYQLDEYETATFSNKELLDNIQERLKTYKEKILYLENEQESLSNKKESLSNRIISIRESLESSCNSSISVYLSKKSTLVQKKQDLTCKIHNLGLLPEEFLLKYKNTLTEKLVQELLKVREQIQKYSHVNQRALDQYNAFVKQHGLLVKRKEELDKSSESIVSFIETLDMQKDEAVQRTFDQVARYFGEVFTQLVPTGKAELELLRSIDSKNNGMTYSGIGIRVSFNGNLYVRMHQLSGGQKGIVSLALIFAIQKCDPAPFYLFDEIDANLDVAYRASVANAIGEMSKKAQFILTTFRPELLDHADKYYGVVFSHSASHIQCIEKEQAEEFLKSG